MTDSRYDELHDRFFSILNSKEGTRYERLAAVVFKILDERKVVIHDFALRGDSAVKHQIDVLIEVNGQKRRVLIECKDFDKSGRLVGLGILRDFRSVVEDTQADEAFVLTCTGYTKPARKYAKAKGIKLAILRLFEEKDWEGRIKEVIVNLLIQMPPRVERIDMGFATEEQAATFRDEAAAAGIQLGIFSKESPFLFVSDTEEIQVMRFLEREASKLPRPLAPTLYEVDVDREAWRVRIGSRAPRGFTKFKFFVRKFPVADPIRLEVRPNRVVELVLQGFGDNDIIICADQLQRAKIDDEGRITYEPQSPPAPGMKRIRQYKAAEGP